MTSVSFVDYLAAVHQRDGAATRTPYRWQSRAAAELAERGWWPAVRAPTGSGKTTLIDCWLHALAEAGPDRLGRRLVWVVDRRAVVDQVYEYACAAVENVRNSPQVAAQLREIGGGLDPCCSLWRGGLDDEASIAMRDPLSPERVAVIVSTVDQVGSRLLFRGYGLGEGSRALHAGLLGLDTTLVLDEAHLAQPFLATLQRVVARQRRAEESPRPPLRVCSVSATHDADGAFELRAEELAEPAIAKRVGAAKPAKLVRGRDGDLVRLVREFAEDGAKLIGVVVNTVAAARRAFTAVASVAEEELTDRVLLIGPVRPLDRLDLLSAIPDREQREDRETPFVVVATQTIEVGVDLDFDALITDCAPLDSLVQRFGRLDRAGELGTSKAAILAPPARGCPVYGPTTAATWSWLESAAVEDVVDCGVAALARRVAELGSPPSAQSPRTVELLDLHVDALTVTDGKAHEGPAIELLLHGEREVSPEVTIAWRGLDLPKPGEAITTQQQQRIAREIELRPLHPGELVSVSLAAAQRWLAGETPTLSDLESDDVREEQQSVGERPRVWRVGENRRLVAIDERNRLRPGDRLIAACLDGGVDRFGWTVGMRRRSGPATDLGSLAARAPHLVLDADAIPPDVAMQLEAGELGETDAADALSETIAAAVEAAVDVRPGHRSGQRFTEQVACAIDKLARGRATLLADGRVHVVAREVRSDLASGAAARLLDDHQRAVETQVVRSLDALRLDGAVAKSLRRAALHHDEGKRDPHFQEWLRGGRVTELGVLAKSLYPYRWAHVERMRELAGWPRGKRHELIVAVALAEADPNDRMSPWFVVTHHGRHRPFVAAVVDDCDDDVVLTIDGQPRAVAANAVPDLAQQLRTFAELTRRFGPWGLAYLESILVSADRLVSSGREVR